MPVGHCSDHCPCNFHYKVEISITRRALKLLEVLVIDYRFVLHAVGMQKQSFSENYSNQRKVTHIYLLSLLKRLSLTSVAIYQSRGLLVCINARGVVSLGHCFFRKRMLIDHSSCLIIFIWFRHNKS